MDRPSLNCPLHRIVLASLLIAALLLAGHNLLDAFSPAGTQHAGGHLHTGFLLPFALGLIFVRQVLLGIIGIDLDPSGWERSPAEPPPRN
jgi:hypothetical protein